MLRESRQNGVKDWDAARVRSDADPALDKFDMAFPAGHVAPKGVFLQLVPLDQPGPLGGSHR